MAGGGGGGETRASGSHKNHSCSPVVCAPLPSLQILALLYGFPISEVQRIQDAMAPYIFHSPTPGHWDSEHQRKAAVQCLHYRRSLLFTWTFEQIRAASLAASEVLRKGAEAKALQANQREAEALNSGPVEIMNVVFQGSDHGLEVGRGSGAQSDSIKVRPLPALRPCRFPSLLPVYLVI